MIELNYHQGYSVLLKCAYWIVNSNTIIHCYQRSSEQDYSFQYYLRYKEQQSVDSEKVVFPENNLYQERAEGWTPLDVIIAVKNEDNKDCSVHTFRTI